MIRRIYHVGVGRKKVIIFFIIIVMIVKYSKERGLFHIIMDYYQKDPKYQRIAKVAQEHAGSSAVRLLSNTPTE